MAGSNNVMRMSPRQRMINLMYIVLTAMLALNVSGDVINGFHQVHDGLKRTNSNIARRNEVQFRYLSELYAGNPQKARQWYEKGKLLRAEASALCTTIDSLRHEIAIEADGRDADPGRLENTEDLEAAAVTMLRPGSDEAKRLRQRIGEFSTLVSGMISDSARRQAVEKILLTEDFRGNEGTISWENRNFDSMPAIAAVTILSKLENDIRQAESEALTNLITNVDIADVRVNKLQAYVIPESQVVMRGDTYSADVVLAAVDTTRRPTLYVNGKKLPEGVSHIDIPASKPGVHSIEGYIETAKGDGSTERRQFTTSYTVTEPMATVSPTMMNVLYAGIDNPISISVPGHPMNAVTATMTNGSLTRNGDRWTARPAAPGKEAVITVTVRSGNSSRPVATTSFRVRKLPDPVPFISIKDSQGNATQYKGSPRRIRKTDLLGAEKLEAALDDDLLDTKFSVVSFSTVFYDSMGNAIPEVSDGAAFSTRQKEQFRRLKPGKNFFITRVRAAGPDGIVRDIPPMEVIVI